MSETMNAVKKSHPIANRIGGVFMHVSSMERSVDWYHKLFGMPERTSVTDKVHGLNMDGGSGLVLDQHGYDRGLAIGDRPLLMFDSPDVHAAYRYVNRLGIPIEWEIEEFPGMAFFTFRDPDGNLLMVCGAPGNKEETNGSPSASDLIRYDGGGVSLSVDPLSKHSRITSDGLELTGRARTETSFAVPLRIETSLRIEGGSLRLDYGPHGRLTFNYGPSANNGAGEEFYVNHPKINKSFDDLKKGAIPINRWVHIEWTILERSMEVRVDGQLFHIQSGYFGGTEGLAGIGCDNGSIIMKSFIVEELSEEETVPGLQIQGKGTEPDMLLPDAVCHPSMTGEGLWLSYNEQWGRAQSRAAYSAPFTMETVIHSDTNSLILYGGASAQVKFHQGGAISFRDPVSKEEVWVDGAGILPNSFSTVKWSMDENRTTISVDGEVRLEHSGDYSGCKFRLGIGADAGCAVVVKSVKIQ
ncbi:VOC family protein [Paenibacillus tarimensis]